MKLSIIIPVYNEQKTILKIINKIEQQKFDKEIIIINDCSKDNTLNLIKNYKFKDSNIILNHYKNLGKGACIKTAQKYISGDIVIIQDADLEYNPEDYKNLIKPILNNETEVVYGSRVLKRSRYGDKNFSSFFRIFANHVLTIISNFINSQSLTDAHTCYKVFSAKLFKNIVLKENGFSFCPEITTKLSNKKIFIVEVPISYQGRDYKEGKKIKFIDGIDAIKTLIKYKLFDKN